MNTVHSLVDQLINPKTVMAKVKDILREVDPDYEKEEQAFIAACSSLESGIDDSVTITVQSYLEALEEEFASDIIFVIGRGFKLNLDIHNNPVNALAFKLDYCCGSSESADTVPNDLPPCCTHHSAPGRK